MLQHDRDEWRQMTPYHIALFSLMKELVGHEVISADRLVIHLICFKPEVFGFDQSHRPQPTTTILQFTGHHYPPLYAIGPPGYGSDGSTTFSALNQVTLDMVLQLH
ncbi:hypothetical protein KIN20_002224 [Parelaphostrongylus tenuis]|uniref:Uncharacterized protein n=1 Tax=Parelaphostrongylus tenuis TaxID=148309 RepID=A0AAD5QHM6_PARTN|nr:hypothetical protein KIN20_002224 [Parelaphostrongylus tenuis]